MKRTILAPVCALAILLSACAEPVWLSPLAYAQPTRQTQSDGQSDGVFLQSAGAQQDTAKRESAKPPVLPSGTPTPDVSEALEKADESLSGGEGSLITDLSVDPGGAAENPDANLIGYAHYIEQNNARYHAFLSAFPDLTAAASLALVNVNADYGYYKGIQVIGEPENLLVLCNKNFQLPADFVPKNLRVIAGTSYKMSGQAATAFETMRQAIKEELGLSLTVLSGYRDFAYQKALYARYASADGAEVADTYSARAGHSEHQTGLAVDFLHKAPSGSLRGANFQNTAQYAWLQAHAHEYGYILRYPEGYEPLTGYRFEPWHWRYIGVTDATRMFEEGIVTFEEYIGTYYAHVDVREAG